MTLVIDWNGKDIPEKLSKLPPGRYVLEDLDETPSLTPEQEEGIRAALRSIDEGRGIPAAEVYARILGKH